MAVYRFRACSRLNPAGEFNSGKSTVINALLGGRYLADGALPTTNEISVLRHVGDASDGAGGERVEQQADGLYVRYLPADLLRCGARYTFDYLVS